MEVRAAALLCCVLLATSPPAALGNSCIDECVAAGCNTWPLICQISCTTACMGQTGILSLNAAAPNNSADAATPQMPGEVSAQGTQPSR